MESVQIRFFFFDSSHYAELILLPFYSLITKHILKYSFQQLGAF